MECALLRQKKIISKTTNAYDSEYDMFNKVTNLGNAHPSKIFVENDVKTVAKYRRTWYKTF